MSAQPLEVRMAGLEGSYRQVSDRLNGIDHRLDGIDHRLDGIDRRLDGFEQRVDARFEATGSKIDRLQWRMTALIFGSWITLIASIFFHR
jgi:hypothetical protein